MRLPVAFTDEAMVHLRSIDRYLTRRFYSASAKRYIERLAAECQSLGEAPHRGRRRDDLATGIRVIGFGRSASIYFKVIDQTVFILGICYGGRTFRPPSER